MAKIEKKEVLRTVKYTLVAASAGIIELGAKILLNNVLGVHDTVSYIIALVLSVLWNFTINRRYTFKSASNIPKAMLLVAAFYAVFTPLSTWFEHFLVQKNGWPGILATILIMIINFVTEFLYQRFVVFKDTIDTNELARREAERGTDKTDHSL
jgi:putative flippase GtrA